MERAPLSAREFADVVTGNAINGFTLGIDILSGATHVNVQSNTYVNNTTNTQNLGGSSNTVGCGSP
jgi:nitrous oxidase accessory protein NosD